MPPLFQYIPGPDQLPFGTQDCWEHDATLRPSMARVVQRLAAMKPHFKQQNEELFSPRRRSTTKPSVEAEPGGESKAEMQAKPVTPRSAPLMSSTPKKKKKKTATKRKPSSMPT